MKKIVLIMALITASLSWGQFSITDVTYNNSDYCQNDSKTFHVTATHPIGQVPSISLGTSSDNAFLSITSANLDSTATVGGTSYFSFITYNTNTAAANTTETDLFTIDLVNVSTTEDSYLVDNLQINGQVSVVMDLSPFQICDNQTAVDISSSVDMPGGEFIWQGGEGAVINPALMFETDQQNGGEGMFFIDYSVQAPNGCTGYASEEVFMNFAPQQSVSTTGSTCGNNDGSAILSISTGAAPYDVYWSNGDTDNGITGASIISDLNAGVYYANVIDANGCKEVSIANVSDSEVTVTSVINEESCSGVNDGLIDLTVTTAGNVTNSFWSNGVTTVDMTGGQGEYSVEINTDNNCSFFGTYVIPNTDLRIILLEKYDIYGCGVNVNQGTLDMTTIGGSGDYSWSWTDNANAEVGNGENLDITIAGEYTLTATDNISGCTVSLTEILPAQIGVNVSLNSTTRSDCGEANGSANVTIDWGDVSYWEWSNGSTDEDLVNVAPGTYILEYKDDTPDQCPSFLQVKIKSTRPYQPEICLLTVDTSLVYNEIVWEKDAGNIVDGYKVYRETSTYGNFELVTTLPYSHESLFIDNAASPVNRSWRYYITSFDACNESYPSSIHKTIHIVVTDITGTNVDLSWDDYEGITYSSIDLMRFDAVNGWQTVVNLPIGTNSYSDTPPVFTDLDYMISFNLASPCTSTKAQDHNASRSNTSSSTFIGGEPTDLSVIEKEEGAIKLYPNPTSDNLNIYIENADDYDMIKIVNINGELVYEQLVSESLNRVSTANFAKGIYFVQIYSENGIVTEKIIKQ